MRGQEKTFLLTIRFVNVNEIVSLGNTTSLPTEAKHPSERFTVSHGWSYLPLNPFFNSTHPLSLAQGTWAKQTSNMVLAKRQLLGLQVLEKKLLLDVVHVINNNDLYTMDRVHCYSILFFQCILFFVVRVYLFYIVCFMMSPGTWYMVHKPQWHVLAIKLFGGRVISFHFNPPLNHYTLRCSLWPSSSRERPLKCKE